MKSVAVTLFFIFCAISAAAQSSRLLVHDMDGDGVADTVRIDRQKMILEYRLSSQEFRLVASKKNNELKSYGSLEPAENRFILHIDNKDDDPYEADYTFRYRPEFRWVALTSACEKHYDLIMSLPGIAPDVTLHKCDITIDMPGNEITLEYSEGAERLKKSYHIEVLAGGPLKYFSFADMRGVLQPLWEKLSWYMMDEVYPVDERTPGFTYALPVDPRSPGLLIYDIDGDSVKDTVRIHRNIDNWDLWLESRLSSQSFESVTTKPTPSHNNKPGLRPVEGGLEFHQMNSESDNYENSDIFIYDPNIRQLVHTLSHGKYFGFNIHFPDQNNGLEYEGKSDLFFFPRQGKYMLKYSEDGQQRSKEYTGKPITILFRDYMSEQDQQEISLLWKEFVATILEDKK